MIRPNKMTFAQFLEHGGWEYRPLDVETCDPPEWYMGKNKDSDPAKPADIDLKACQYEQYLEEVEPTSRMVVEVESLPEYVRNAIALMEEANDEEPIAGEQHLEEVLRRYLIWEGVQGYERCIMDIVKMATWK